MKTLVTRSVHGVDHCQGVPHALAKRGTKPECWLLEHMPPQSFQGSGAIMLADCCGPWALNAIRHSREFGARCILMQDGLCEWRNIYSNTQRPPAMLRPAPVDTICCAGQQDQLVLEHLGNRAVTTGLPRLHKTMPLPLPEHPALLVATAKHSWFTPYERQAVLELLANVRATLARRSINVLWRVSTEATLALGIQNTPGDLTDLLARASAVLTLPSTLLVEAIISGRPTAILHPFDSPCWLPSVWSIRARPEHDTRIDKLDQLHQHTLAGKEMRVAATGLDDLLDDMLCPCIPRLEAQKRVSEILHNPGDASSAVAQAVLFTAGREPGPGTQSPLPSLARLPSVATPTQHESRQMILVTQPQSACGATQTLTGESVCVVDPTWDTHTARQHVVRAIEHSLATIVIRDEDTHSDFKTNQPTQIGDESSEKSAENLIPAPDEKATRLFRDALDSLRTHAHTRIVIFGIGQHTHRILCALYDDDPIVGFLDDSAFPGQHMLGLPVVQIREVVKICRPDAVVLSSDVYEEQMFEKCARLQSSGIRIVKLYGDIDIQLKQTEASRLQVR